MTWNADDLPTSVIVAARESTSAASPASCSAGTPFRRVIPKARDFRARPAPALADLLKVLAVLLVRAGIAALDEVEAAASQLLGQEKLVLEREADAFGLGAVAERGVVDLDATHGIAQKKRPQASVGLRAGFDRSCYR